MWRGEEQEYFTQKKGKNDVLCVCVCPRTSLACLNNGYSWKEVKGGREEEEEGGDIWAVLIGH